MQQSNADVVTKDEEVKLSRSDEDLRQVVQVIVSEFDGNTVAFYKSIQPEGPKEEQDQPDPAVLSDSQGKITAWD
jgi:hypothetical protein